MSFEAEIPDILAELGASIVGASIILEDEESLKDPRVQATLRKIAGAFKANPLLRYYPHPKQAFYHGTRRPIKMFVGGERSGKTLGGNADDIIQVVDWEFVPEHLRPYKIWDPPFFGRVVTPDFGASYAEILRSLEEWIPKSQLHLGNWESAFSDKKHVLNFANGGFLEFMTQMQDVSQFGGTSRHRVRYDEEPKGLKGEAIREANIMRLAQFRGDECFNFSPVHGLGSVGEDLWEERGEEVAKEVWVSPRMVIVRASQDDNPHLDEEGKREAEEKIPERMRAARQRGQFVHGAGLVYEEFDRDIHVCPPLDPEFVKSLEQIDGLDPGLNTAVLFAGFDSDGVLWFYEELFLTDSQSLPERVVAKLFAKRTEWLLKLRPQKTYIDPAAGAKSNRDGGKTKLEDLYRGEGLKLRQADNDVEVGVDEIKRRLVHENKDGEPAPLIQIAENCTGLIWEFGRYRKEHDAGGELVIVKENDHRIDVARYIAMHKRQKKKKRRKRPDREYIPGTAPPIGTYPDQRSMPPMGSLE
jgi:hypothetical protein